MVLLASLVGYPELGPDLFPHIHEHATADPAASWSQLVRGLQPTPDAGTWHNAVRNCLDKAHAQQWESLRRALCNIEEQAQAQGVPLPGRLATWAPWVEPVGRLSFPTGRVVSALDRHPPLSHVTEHPERPDPPSAKPTPIWRKFLRQIVSRAGRPTDAARPGQ
jgi:hypothetical protein